MQKQNIIIIVFVLAHINQTLSEPETIMSQFNNQLCDIDIDII